MQYQTSIMFFSVTNNFYSPCLLPSKHYYQAARFKTRKSSASFSKIKFIRAINFDMRANSTSIMSHNIRHMVRQHKSALNILHICLVIFICSWLPISLICSLYFIMTLSSLAAKLISVCS